MKKLDINTLSGFLQQSGAKYRVFDMGRRVSKISADSFLRFELAQDAYPYPLQKKAFLAITFWQPQQIDKQYVWFLQFPLDEQGLLNQAARDEFLSVLLERVGKNMLAAASGEKIETALKDSAYAFKPHEDKMAAFNAVARKSLASAPSQFYPAALSYFMNEQGVDSWEELAMQGVADVAVRIDDEKITAALIKIIPSLPEQPFHVLASFLEHVQPSAELTAVYQQRLTALLKEEKSDINSIVSCLRAVSNSTANGMVDSMVKNVLRHSCSQNIEVLATIVGRIWRIFITPALCQLFVERLAENDAGTVGFSHLLADVMFMPKLRPAVMQALRSPQRTAALSREVGIMFGQS